MKEVSAMENKFTPGVWSAPQTNQNNGIQQSTTFSQSILSQDPTKKVINLGVVGNAKKRPAEEPVSKPIIETFAANNLENNEEKENINILPNNKDVKSGDRTEVVTKTDDEGNPEKKIKLN
jgi:hypothetical protein